ncbi:P-loop containing nucleoside triphosphate hydrolase protein [Fimicolochytrium jonesii]|uniref:P-loop containing nucleoside triphosphate hydrolase protein n=1 Tax=Fimicolochytrium jonesii TaxID=1396493 RepID=UPI0022FE4ACD|nr:P-loop containing nucleoside triphosphate hydrolase protein [Fimicolochytrium jonesii]KAI8820019.1 P-loop containing nucleoside triphosphate hydrolase protein [Fimicolochytrium jonesii]
MLPTATDLMAGRIYPSVDNVGGDSESIDMDLENPRLLRPKEPGLPRLSTSQLFSFATWWEVVLMFLAALASMGSGSINLIAINAIGSTLAGLMSGTGQGLSGIGEKAFLFAGLALYAFCSKYISRALWTMIAERQVKRISSLFLESVLRQDMEWFDLSDGDSLSTRLSNDVPLIRIGLGESAEALFSVAGNIIGCLLVSFWNDAKLTGIILSLLPLLIGCGVVIVKVNASMAAKSGDAYARASSVPEQALSGIRTVYAFTLQRRFMEKYEDSLRQVEQVDIRKAMFSGLSMGVFSCILFLIFALSFYIGTHMVLDGRIPGPNAVVVLLAMMILASSLMDVPRKLSSIATAQAAARLIYYIIWRKPSIDRSFSENNLLNVTGDISFKNVRFSYPSRPDVPILRGLSVDIKAGQTVAFVGGSGSGKSTTIALLQRLYDPTSGVVTLDGKDVKDMKVSALRKHIGVVGQEPVLFSLTIRQNILLGIHGEVSPNVFISACKMAQCHSFVTKFPLGYDTPVSPGKLSGGQKQRIAIARAILKNPKILLLDEATSALDTTSERLVQKALDAASAGRTTIVIAHRLSTIRNAHVICVMNCGKLVEMGTHEQLYSMGGEYTALVDKQKLSVEAETGQPKRDYGAEMESHGQQPILETEEVRDMLKLPTVTLDPPDTIARQIRLKLKAERLIGRREAARESQRFFRRVRKLLDPETKLIVGGTIAGAFSGLVFPGFAVIISFTIGEVLKEKTADTWISYMVLVAGLAFTTQWAQSALYGKAVARATFRLRLSVFRNLLRQEVGFFDAKANAPGSLCNRLAAVENVPRMLTDIYGDSGRVMFTAIYGIALSLAFSMTLAGILLLLAPFIIAAGYWQSTSLARFAESSKEAYEQSTQVAMEAIKEVKTLKMLDREKFAVERYEAFLDKPFRMTKRNAFVDSIAYGLQDTASMLTIALGFYAGQKLADRGSIELWQIMSVVLGMMTTMISISSSAGLGMAYVRGKLASQTTFAILDRETSIDPDKAGITPEDFRADFQFSNLVFQYPTSPEPIFTGMFSLAGVANKSLALVGPSGCGKSTVIGLLQRWYDPQGGAATLGGTKISQYQLLKGLRPHMALVGQEPILFDLTIGENIAWGSEAPVTRSEIQEAAGQANAHSFIKDLPEGYDTRVGERAQLSGGQRQRIAIARSLIRRPKLLLLDEATSALDSRSELEVQKAIDRAATGRTTVTIAHRLSTIKNVDQIAVVQDGRVAELGTHNDLVARNGIYAQMCREQNL